MKEFWKDWKRKTKLEEAAINSLKTAKKIILENVPKEEIVCIYAKGSLVRRELNKNSDVDTTTILKTRKYVIKLKNLTKKYGHTVKPDIQLGAYTLWELKNNKRVKRGKDSRPSPSRILKHVEYYKPIYGKPIKKEDFYNGCDIKILTSMIKVFRNMFLPYYKQKKFAFSEISKQVFWLVENEQRAIGNNPPHNWKKLAKTIKDKEHIIHDTLKFRLKPTKDKKEQANYIRKLNKYLKELDKIVK